MEGLRYLPQKAQSWDLNTQGPGETMGACLWGAFRGDYYKAVKCYGILGDHCLLQNLGVDFPFS